MRVAFETKINKLYNYSVTLKQHEKTLTSQAETAKASLIDLKERLEKQEIEILALKSFKAKAELEYDEFQTNINCSKDELASTKLAMT